MPFLTEEDYTVQIRTEILDRVKNNDGSLLKAEDAAQEEMESYLRDRYDVANIFNKQGQQRSSLIILYMIDITLYHLHSNISPRNIPELRGIRYEAAINWLNRVALGKLFPDLPIKENGASDTDFIGSSNPRYSQPW